MFPSDLVTEVVGVYSSGSQFAKCPIGTGKCISEIPLLSAFWTREANGESVIGT